MRARTMFCMLRSNAVHLLIFMFVEIYGRNVKCDTLFAHMKCHFALVVHRTRIIQFINDVSCRSLLPMQIIKLHAVRRMNANTLNRHTASRDNNGNVLFTMCHIAEHTHRVHGVVCIRFQCAQTGACGYGKRIAIARRPIYIMFKLHGYTTTTYAENCHFEFSIRAPATRHHDECSFFRNSLMSNRFFPMVLWANGRWVIMCSEASARKIVCEWVYGFCIRYIYIFSFHINAHTNAA